MLKTRKVLATVHKSGGDEAFEAHTFLECCTKPSKIEQETQLEGIGNCGGKQGRGNQPPYRRYGPDTEIQYRPRKPHGPAKLSRILSKREADTEFQY